MASCERLLQLADLGKITSADGIPGDIVECGVFNGGSAAAIVIGSGMDSQRKAYLFDSFEGMPEPGGLDGKEAEEWTGRCVGSPDRVREIFRTIGFPEANLNIRKGWFDETFSVDPLPKNIAILHIDADWYQSVLTSLESFYDSVSEGGIIILDDFGHWEGCREAFYDFCTQKGIKPLLERTGDTQAYWRKGTVHNRNS